jgi:hypothetical protein
MCFSYYFDILCKLSVLPTTDFPFQFLNFLARISILSSRLGNDVIQTDSVIQERELGSKKKEIGKREM